MSAEKRGSFWRNLKGAVCVQPSWTFQMAQLKSTEIEEFLRQWLYNWNAPKISWQKFRCRQWKTETIHFSSRERETPPLTSLICPFSPQGILRRLRGNLKRRYLYRKSSDNRLVDDSTRSFFFVPRVSRRWAFNCAGLKKISRRRVAVFVHTVYKLSICAER